MDSVHLLIIALALLAALLYALGLIAVLAGAKPLYGKGQRIPMLKMAIWPILIMAAVFEEVWNYVFED